MLLGQAGRHGAKVPKEPSCATIVPPPPRSLELNPAERVWLYQKERYLSRRLLDVYDSVVEATYEAGDVSSNSPAA